MTELLYQTDAYLQAFCARVTDVDREDHRIALDQTCFYPTGGGQPHDVGTLDHIPVLDVVKDGDAVWHELDKDGGVALPQLGYAVAGKLDWKRRHALMRTHTAVHVLCGVIWHEWRVPVTGGNMEPLSARVDFEFDSLPDGFELFVEHAVNDECEAARPIVVSFLDRSIAVLDEDLIRTKVSLVPSSVKEVRVVDIVGLDKQADGGTHVANTTEVGSIRVVKVESKGRGNKRVRFEILPSDFSTSDRHVSR